MVMNPSAVHTKTVSRKDLFKHSKRYNRITGNTLTYSGGIFIKTS